MQTLDSTSHAGFAPKPLSSRIFIRGYRHYGEAKHAYDQLRVVATGHVEPRQYDILVEEQLAPQAREVLGRTENGQPSITCRFGSPSNRAPVVRSGSLGGRSLLRR
jgi:hypothetical protein